MLAITSKFQGFYFAALTRFIALFYALVLIVSLSCLTPAQTSYAQDLTAIVTAPEGLTLRSIAREKDRIQNNSELSATQVETAAASYDTAETAFNSAQEYLEQAREFNAIIVSGPKRFEQLRTDITDMQELPPVNMDDEADSMTAEKLVNSQQTLIAKEAEQRSLRAQLTDIRAELETLQTRRNLAPDEQAQTLTIIETLQEQISARGERDKGAIDAAQTTALKARLYLRRAQSAALELEIASFTERQRGLVARETLTQLKLSRVAEDVTALQRLTGQRRKIEARRLITQTQTTLANMKAPQDVNAPPTHPLLLEYAAENLALTEQLYTIAEQAGRLPQRKAKRRSQIDILQADLTTADSLISLGNLSRQSATTLRQLRNDNETVGQVQGRISRVNQDIAVATQDRLLAQNQIRQMGLTDAELQSYVANWQAANPAAESFPESGIAALSDLQKDRRVILTEITDTSRDRIDDLTQLKSTLDVMLTRSKTLKNLLETNLLWLPSIAAIDFSWPAKVVKGAAAIFSPRHFVLIWTTLIESLKENLLWALILFILASSCFTLRERLWADIKRRAGMVGRVQKDSYLHTPAVILSCILIALPLPIIFVLIGVLFDFAPSQDPFIDALGRTAYYLAIFTAFFLTWRAWDRDLSLFDKHFKLGADLRHAINCQLRWFIPVAATSTGLIQLTVDSQDPNVFEGLSLAAFLVTTFAIAIVSYQILWKRRRENDTILRHSENQGRYIAIFSVIMIGIPVFCGIFASLGYYETTSELLYRLFVSGWLLVASYVVYGTTRRTVVVSKRRLALEQAVERREKAVKARQELKKAEDRGDETPPPPAVNYDDIDIETVSRQTEKLLNAFMVVLFAVLMWTIWSDLLPALSFFNNVELGHYMVDVIDAETNSAMTVERAITLWNLMQAGVIIWLTVMAARNLPGFLEVFALNRLGFDAGTRYAIVTILGYIIFGLGLFMGLDRLGLQWSQLKWIVTGLSVGIGLGLQKIIANFVSGLIILFERPVRLGDYVTIGDQSGTVTRIQIRATTLVDLDNREIIIPNEALISERVTNWTLSNSITRLVLNVGVAYGTDTDKVREIILSVAKRNPLILDSPATQVIFSGFGDSSLDFEVRTFLKCFEDRVQTRHALHTEINKAFEKAGISIPFPQRDLHVITPGDPLKS